MPKVLLQPEVVALAKEEPDPGYLELPEKIYCYDLIKYRLSKNEEISPDIEQFIKSHNFYYSNFSISVGINKKAKGAKWVYVKGQIVDKDSNPINIDDKGPKTSWVKTSNQYDMKIKINFNPISNLFELVNISNLIEGAFQWNWNHDPKIGEIITSGTGSRVEWRFSATAGKYVDGNHDVYFVVRVPKNIDELYFKLIEAQVEYDYKFATDILYFKNSSIRIPLEVPSTNHE